MVEYNKFPKKGRVISGKGPRDLQRQNRQQPDAVSNELLETLQDEIKYLRSELGKKPDTTGRMFSEEDLSARINNAVVDSVNEVKAHYEKQMKDLQESLKVDSDTKELKLQNTKLKSSLDDVCREKQFSEEKFKLTEHTLKQKEVDFLRRAKEVESLQNEVVKLHTNNEKLQNANVDLSGDLKELKVLLTNTNQRMETLMATAHEGMDIVDPDRPKMEEIFIDPSDMDSEFEAHLEVEDTLCEFEKETLDDKVDKLKSLFSNGIPGR